MSPANRATPTARESLIRILAANIAKGFGISREQAKELLVKLTGEERYLLYRVRSMARGYATAKENFRRRPVSKPRTEAQRRATLALIASSQSRRANQ